MSSLSMKNLLMLNLLLASTLMLRAQVDPVPPPAPPPRAQGHSFGGFAVEAPTLRYPGFATFNINFLGGPPEKLVLMITNQTHKPLNVIIPPDYADTELPPLNLNNVTVPQLFDALEQASKRKVTYLSGLGVPGAYQNIQQGATGFGFKTTDPKREDSVWYV